MNYRKINELIKNFPFPIRSKLYKKFGMQIGSKSVIGSGCFIDNPNKICIGSNTLVNYKSQFHSGGGTITIGNNCQISYNVNLICTSHDIGSHYERAGERIHKPIVIEDGVWIGANALIMPGVTIGAGTVIGAGAVVVKDCENDSVYVGVPAKK